MPEHSGIDLIRWSRRKQYNFRIIGMSAEHFKGIQMLEAGATDFIEKPIDIENLRHLLAKHQSEANCECKCEANNSSPNTKWA